jgi:hypothetical protein
VTVSEGTPIDRDKLLSIGYLAGGRTRPKVAEGRDEAGDRFKATTDELGNTVTERAGDRQDVALRPQTIHYVKEKS